jgi:hypothetical protein
MSNLFHSITLKMSSRSVYCSQIIESNPSCLDTIRSFLTTFQNDVPTRQRYQAYISNLERIQRQSTVTIPFLTQLDTFLKDALTIACQFRHETYNIPQKWKRFFGKQVIEEDAKETTESYCNYNLASFAHAFDTFYPTRSKFRAVIFRYFTDLYIGSTSSVFNHSNNKSFDESLKMCYATKSAKQCLLYFVDALISAIFDQVHRISCDALENMLYQMQYCKQYHEKKYSEYKHKNIVASSSRQLEESTWGCNDKEENHEHGMDCFMTPYTRECLMFHNNLTFAPDHKVSKAECRLMKEVAQEVELYQTMYQEYIQCVQYLNETLTIYIPPTIEDEEHKENENEILPLCIRRFNESNLDRNFFYSSKSLEMVLQTKEFHVIYDSRFQYFFF